MRISPHFRLAAALLVGLLTFAPRSGQAQAPVASPRHVLSVNPFLPLAGYFQGEFETKLKENVALAISGAHTRLDDYYTSLDVKLRLYPQERGLQGFGLFGVQRFDGCVHGALLVSGSR
jgi:hypothetical protein